MPSFGLLAWAACAAGALVLGGSTWFSAEGTASARATAAVVGALLGAGLGVVLAALEAGLVRLVGARLARLGDRLGIARYLDRSADAPREPIVDLHARAVGALVGVIVLAATFRFWIVRLRKVQNADLAETLTLLGGVGLALFAVALALGVSFLLRRPVRWLDRRFGLPRPASRRLRLLFWAAVPLGVASHLAIKSLGKHLGPFASPLWVGLTIAVQIAVLAAIPAMRPRARWLAVLPIVAALVAFGAADRTLAAQPRAAFALEAASPATNVLALLRRATDVDFDGSSSLFAGRDCAPLSRSRGPHAHDDPGNGVDEDCDGADTPEGAALPTAPTFWGELPAERVRRYDVVWFVVDALRSDHTGAGGYNKPTTPYLDELAKESWFFTHAFSQSSATMLSFPSMLTGVDPGKLEWRLDRGRLQLAPGQPFLSERFGSLGYKTGFIAAEYFEKRLPGLLEGWTEVTVQEKNQRKSSASSAAHAASFIARARATDAPFFLVVYLPAPHAPYVEHAHGYPKFGGAAWSKYDAEIANADRYLGFVLDVLRSDPARYKRTVIIATGDHGEEFGEHGGSEHANNCHRESVHVPLVVRVPDEEPERIDVPVGLVDVTPALLELVGAPTVEGQRLDGHSLLLAKHAPERLSAERPLFCSVVSQKASQGDFFRRAVRSGKWALFKEMRGSQAVTLYDIVEDPGETAPVTDGADADEARARLDTWLSLQLTGNVGSAPLTGD